MGEVGEISVGEQQYNYEKEVVGNEQLSAFLAKQSPEASRGYIESIKQASSKLLLKTKTSGDDKRERKYQVERPLYEFLEVYDVVPHLETIDDLQTVSDIYLEIMDRIAQPKVIGSITINPQLSKVRETTVATMQIIASYAQEDYIHDMQKFHQLLRVYPSLTEELEDIFGLEHPSSGDEITREHFKQRYKEWQEIITDSDMLDKTLRVIESIKDYDPTNKELYEFVDYFMDYPVESKVIILNKAAALAEKQIPPQFLLMFMRDEEGLEKIANLHPEDDGLAIFGASNLFSAWFQFIPGKWVENPQTIDKTIHFFKEGLEHEDKLIRLRAQHGIDKVLDGFLKAKDITPIITLAQKLPLDVELERFQTNFIDDIQNGHLIRGIPILGIPEGKVLFPKAYDAVLKGLDEQIAHNPDVAEDFIENLPQYHSESWVPNLLDKAATHFSAAVKISNLHIQSESNPDELGWIEELLTDSVSEKVKDSLTNKNPIINSNDAIGFMGVVERDDPFADHLHRFTGEQIRVAHNITKILQGKLSDEEIYTLGFDGSFIGYAKYLNKEIFERYEKFLEDIEYASFIPQEDKDALLHPENLPVKMTPLIDNVQAFVARYIVQKYGVDKQKLADNLVAYTTEIGHVLARGFQLYKQIYEHDIPLYDKLYQEFDEMRESGRKPMEMYLGRDGIYAYIGRRAQDLARRKKFSTEERKALEESGELMEIKPRYMVYPRDFRDYLSDETKRKYLAQQEISPDADPLFYDTGYTGSIPEDIMRIMGFTPEDIEQRIRLLSAPNEERRVRRISDNARRTIVEYIEHNAKTENSSIGLIHNNEKDTLRHIAVPTSPEEQFNFMLIKQALQRHYWLKEQLHHKPSEYTTRDARSHLLRIKKEMSGIVPQEFISYPAQYIEQHGVRVITPYENRTLYTLPLGEKEYYVFRTENLDEVRESFRLSQIAEKEGSPNIHPLGMLIPKSSEQAYFIVEKPKGALLATYKGDMQESHNYLQVKRTQIKEEDIKYRFQKQYGMGNNWTIAEGSIEIDDDGYITSLIPLFWYRAQSRKNISHAKYDHWDEDELSTFAAD